LTAPGRFRSLPSGLLRIVNALRVAVVNPSAGQDLHEMILVEPHLRLDELLARRPAPTEDGERMIVLPTEGGDHVLVGIQQEPNPGGQVSALNLAPRALMPSILGRRGGVR
jgi:hypothetical protein